MTAKNRTPRVQAAVFWPSVIVLVSLVVITLLWPAQAQQHLQALLQGLIAHFGWFYLLAVAGFLLFIIVIACSHWGSIRLGADHSEPEYGFWSWFAMLFSAGYGIALLFFGVAEPVLHYASPPGAPGDDIAAAKAAMQIAFFHWGFHIWAIYGLVGLVLAYFAFRHGLPLSMRSALFPLIGDRIHGPLGHAVDSFAILGTVFGLATTLGLSVIQFNAGLHALLPAIPVHVGVQVLAIALISVLTLVSVVAGLDRGVKRLSQLNLLLVLTLLLTVFVLGPSRFLLESWLQNTGSYLNTLPERTFNLQAYSRSNWIGNWTLFIFSWTIAWAPFVGLFIARISRGRSLRQFIAGVLLVPTAFTFFWFSVFGGTALDHLLQQAPSTLIAAVEDNPAVALFRFFELLPLTELLSGLAVLLILTFFVTSSDSGALVMTALSAGGDRDGSIGLRVFWVLLTGILAAVLLFAGGLQALQALTIASALPFALIMLAGAWGLWRALHIETHRTHSLARPVSHSDGTTWQTRLQRLLAAGTASSIGDFLDQTVRPALQTLADALNAQGWSAEVAQQPGQAVTLRIRQGRQVDFLYAVRAQSYPRHEALTAAAVVRAEVFLRRGNQGYDVFGYDPDALIGDALQQFERYLHFRHISPGSLPWEASTR